MTDTIHFLACVGEECGEIQQEVGKALRFGLDDVNPVTNEKNRDAITREFNDLCGAMITLFDCSLDELIDYRTINTKNKKIMKWLSYSKDNNS
jgi:hypothetical protein